MCAEIGFTSAELKRSDANIKIQKKGLSWRLGRVTMSRRKLSTRSTRRTSDIRHFSSRSYLWRLYCLITRMAAGSPRGPGYFGQAGQLFSRDTQAIYYNW